MNDSVGKGVLLRIISLVPSWTETFVEANLNVVGRTRYCVHPLEKLKNVPKVGGTKNVDWAKIRRLMPDVIIVDQEENPKEFLEQNEFKFFVTHVTSLQSGVHELEKLAAFFQSEVLFNFSQRFQKILLKPPTMERFLNSSAILNWIRRPKLVPDKFIYVIWKKPWMTVTPQTYIGSVLKWCGLENAIQSETRYPKIEIEKFPNALFLFSSEPYPFSKEIKIIEHKTTF